MLAGFAFAVVGCAGVGEIEQGTSDEAQDERPPLVDPQAGCALACHGTELGNAPPRGLGGITETTARGVGAHASHVGFIATFHRQVRCDDCHAVPATVAAPGHLDASPGAELIFSAIAGPDATYDGATCTVACHGSAALGGALPVPVWTRVDGTQATCGSCHGAPPPAPHPDDARCATCHPTMEEDNVTFRDPARHIDGIVDVVAADATGGCTTCHGSPTSSAPPRDLSGATEPTARGVGAHAAHLASSTFRRAIACTACHAVPTTVADPRHLDGDDRAEVTFDALNPLATYDPTTGGCANLYCHGTGRASSGAATWNRPGKLACGACHTLDGTAMSGDHRRHIAGEGLPCAACHAQVIDGRATIIDPTLHVDGIHQVKMRNGVFDPVTRRCSNTGCHGTETW